MAKRSKSETTVDSMNIVAQLSAQAAASSSGQTKIIRAEDVTEPHVVRADYTADDDAQDNNLRPHALDEFLGQSAIKKKSFCIY